MPLNVRTCCTSATLALFGFAVLASAQTAPVTPPPQPVPTPAAQPPTSGDVMRERISKAKAYIAVRNYHAAIFELENVRKETSDAAVHGVVNVLLMNSYLEQGDYKRAQDLLTKFYGEQKTAKAGAPANYMAVAGQIVKGARSRVERYRALGLSVSDRTLPLEATNDLEKMRETLELVITQSKELGANKAKTSDAMMLLEEASSSRSMLARDDYDSRRWRDEVADTREQITSSRSVVVSAVGEPTSTASNNNLANTNSAPASSVPVLPVADIKVIPPPVVPRDREATDAGTQPVGGQPAVAAANERPVDKPIVVPSAPPSPTREDIKPEAQLQTPTPKTVADSNPLAVGSLVNYATNRSSPVYPTAAKTLRTTGIVTVEVTVNENGEVANVEKASGPMMLQAAAKDAIRKWKFKPFTRDGQPVKATGFVNFNFSL